MHHHFYSVPTGHGHERSAADQVVLRNVSLSIDGRATAFINRMFLRLDFIHEQFSQVALMLRTFLDIGMNGGLKSGEDLV